MKVQSEAERGSSPSLVVGGRAGEKDGVVRGSSPSMVVSGEAGEEDGVVIMMDAAPLDIVRVMSTHREQEKHIRWGISDEVPIDKPLHRGGVC